MTAPFLHLSIDWYFLTGTYTQQITLANLIEGYLDWDIPSIDVVHSLDRLGLPYTGPNAELYDPPKVLMKYFVFSIAFASSPIPLR